MECKCCAFNLKVIIYRYRHVSCLCWKCQLLLKKQRSIKNRVLYRTGTAKNLFAEVKGKAVCFQCGDMITVNHYHQTIDAKKQSFAEAAQTFAPALTCLLYCIYFWWNSKVVACCWDVVEVKPGLQNWKGPYSECPVKPVQIFPQRLTFWATTAVCRHITCSAAVNSLRKNLQTPDHCDRFFFFIPLPSKNTSGSWGEMLTLPVLKKKKSIFSTSYLLRSQLFYRAFPTMSGTKNIYSD